MSVETTSPSGSVAAGSNHTETVSTSAIKKETNGTVEPNSHTTLNPAQPLYTGQHDVTGVTAYSGSTRPEHLSTSQLQSSEVENFFSNLDATRNAHPVASIPASYEEANSLATLTSAQSGTSLYSSKGGHYSTPADFYKSSNMFVPTSAPLIPHAYSVTNR